MIETVGVVTNSRAVNLLLEKVPNIMPFSCVIPSNELYQIWLQIQHLFKSLWQVDFSNAVPVLACTKIFELETGYSYIVGVSLALYRKDKQRGVQRGTLTHQKYFTSGPCLLEKVLINAIGYIRYGGAWRRPRRLPAEDTIGGSIG